MSISTSFKPGQNSQLITRLRHVILYLIPCVTLSLTGLVFFASAGRDDAHITYWPVHTLLKFGQILNYNGEPIEQSSSLLQVVVLAGLAKITGLEIVSLGKTSSVLFGMTSLLVLSRMVTKAADRAAGFSAAMITATAVFYVYWSYGGLESTLVSLTGTLVIMMTAIYLNDQAKLSPFWPALVMFLFELVRPEALLILGCLLAGVLVVIGLREAFASKRNLTHRVFLERTLSLLGIWLATSCLVFLFRWSQFGSLFPQPVSAKSDGFSLASLESGIFYIKNAVWGNSFGISFLAIIITISASVLLLNQWRAVNLEPYILFSLLYVIVNLAFVIFAGGDWMEGGRFFVHFLPVSIALIPLALAKVTQSKLPLMVITLILLATQIESLISFARDSSTGFPIWSQTQIDPSFNPSKYSWFERHNRLNLRDMPAIEYLDDVVTVLVDHEHRPVIILSGQMGMIAYHVGRIHYGDVYFMDRFGLTDRTFTDCPVTQGLRKETIGLQLDYEFFFQNLTALKRACHLREPDLILDIGAVTDSQVGNYGYTAIYVQSGNLRNDDALFKGVLVRADEFLAVRNDLLPLLDKVQPVSVQLGD